MGHACATVAQRTGAQHPDHAGQARGSQVKFAKFCRISPTAQDVKFDGCGGSIIHGEVEYACRHSQPFLLLTTFWI